MDKYLLIKYNGDWADEFDVDLLWVTTEEEFEQWKNELSTKDIDESVEIYFGTNEFISFSSYEEIIENIEVSEISKDFYNTFIKLIGNSFGLIDLLDLPERYGENN